MGQSPSTKTRARRLLALLRGLQKKDWPIPPPMVFAVKHLLLQNSHCSIVQIKINPGEDQGCNLDHHLLPTFFFSQLDSQGLTDISSGGVDPSWILQYILRSLSASSAGGPRQKEHPTLFRWYSKPRHRYYYIFALLRHKMPRNKVYTIQELLSLQDHQVCRNVQALAANPEIADIVRTPGCKPAEAKLVAKKSKDDSSASSDELLFKGNMNRRAFRAPTRESAGESSREPIRETIREHVLEPTREPAHGPVRGPPHEPVREPHRELVHDHLRELTPHEISEGGISDQWKYRGRSDSEVATGEPCQAPTGIPAQKSEGFQRFYQAVVSPTHVRVTAGGRIVPNTRGPSSPASKRSNDQNATDGHGMPEKATHTKPSPGQMGMTTPVPIVPQFIPNYPPGFQPVQAPVSFVPISFGPSMAPNFPFGQNAVSTPVMVQPARESTLKDMHNMKSGETRNENGSTTDKQEKVKLTPPEFFDYTRPYYFNGQFMYPISAAAFPPPGMGGQMMPAFQMVGFPPGMAPQPAGQLLQSTPVGGAPSMSAAPFPPAPMQSSAGSTALGHNVPVNTNIQHPSAPPISSIRLSDITKKQIATFKSSLRYNEDQLHYNRHQIDEKEMENKIQTLHNHIRRFEALLKEQLLNEESVLQQGGQIKEEKPMAVHVGEGTKISPQSAMTATHLAQPNPNSSGGQPAGRDSNMNQSQKLGSVWSPNIDPKTGKKRYFVDIPEHELAIHLKKSGLPSDAALAPVFKPRGAASSWEGTLRESRERRLTATTIAATTMPHATSTFFEKPVRKFKPMSSILRLDPTKYGVPYLLGTLPKGVDPREAVDGEYIYHRELTPEEQRARYLFWGGCPDSVPGLPLFDGKHFYPPPSAKERTPSPSQDPPPRRIPTSRPENDYDFRGTKSELDPFRPMTPVQKPGPSRQLMVSEDGYATARHIGHYERETSSSSEDQQMMSEDGAAQELGNTAPGTHESNADMAALSHQERRSGGSSGAKLWPAMLKKASTSSAVSSTTAQGYLPQYLGHAAASLSPSMKKNSISPIREASPGKASLDFSDRSDGGALLTPTLENRRENLPLNSVSSLEDQFKNIPVASLDRHDMPGPFSL